MARDSVQNPAFTTNPRATRRPFLHLHWFFICASPWKGLLFSIERGLTVGMVLQVFVGYGISSNGFPSVINLIIVEYTLFEGRFPLKRVLRICVRCFSKLRLLSLMIIPKRGNKIFRRGAQSRSSAGRITDGRCNNDVARFQLHKRQ